MSATRETVKLWIEDAAKLGDVDSYSAKRTHKRYACHWEVEMKLGPAVHRVIVRDVSDAGVGIISPVEVGAGRSVSIRRHADESWVEARIMHATQTIGRFKLGAIIQFDESGSRPRRPDEVRQVAESYLALARLKLTRGDTAAAELLVRECVEIRRKTLGAEHWLTALAESALGECLVAMGRFAGAEPLLLTSYPKARAHLEADDERIKTAFERVIQLYEAMEEPERAEAFRKQCAADETSS